MVRFDSQYIHVLCHLWLYVGRVICMRLLKFQQECIPVGCVPPAAVAIGGGGLASSPSTCPLGVGLDHIPLNVPFGCGPGPDPPQLPPWVWGWTRSPSTSPLGVGLDQIPFNFPLGCGPGPDPPQLPPWLWAWTRSPSTSPLVVGLVQIPLNSPLGCRPGDPPDEAHAPGTRQPSPCPCGQTAHLKR